MGNPYDDAFEEGNPYDTAIGDQIPPWQGLLQKAAGSLRQSQFGPFPFIPQSQEELQDVPGVATKSASNIMLGLPEMASGGQIDEPQTEWGKQMSTASSIAPLALGGAGLAKGIGTLGKRFGTPQRIAEVQKAFFPWVRKHTGEFGKALRESRKAAGQKSQLGVSKNQLEALFSPIRGSKDAAAQLPPKVLKEVKSLFNKETVSVDDLANVSARMRRTLTSGERTGRQLTERRRTIMQVEGNIKDHLNEILPGMKKAKADYIPFSKIRETMTEKFTPGELKYGKFGSEKAYDTMKNIKQQPTPVVEAFKQFEKETGKKFVGAAKRKATVGAIGNATGKALPWALLTGGLGAGGYIAAKGLLSGIE